MLVFLMIGWLDLDKLDALCRYIANHTAVAVVVTGVAAMAVVVARWWSCWWWR